MKKQQPISKRICRACLLFITILTISCQDSTLYHSYQPVQTIGWDKNDTLVYTLPQALSNQPYIYEIGIRHKDSYPYRDIWLTINQDTVHLYLADSIGNWRGNGIGGIRQSNFPIRLSQPTKDSIKEFRITHVMRDHPLNGILNIGLKIEKNINVGYGQHPSEGTQTAEW